MKRVPFNNLLVVKEIKKEKESTGGIILPERHIGRFVWYEVIAVGPLVDWIKPGEIIEGNPTPPNEELEDGTKYINSADLFGRIEK